MGKKGQYVLIRHGGAFYRMHSCHLMKVNKHFGNPKNDENKLSSNEINEILEEEDEGQQDKSPNSKIEELKDNTEKLCRNTVVDDKMNGSQEWRKKEDYVHTAKINPENIAIDWI